MCEIGWLVRWRFLVVPKVLCICVENGKVFKVVFVGSLGPVLQTDLGPAYWVMGISNLELLGGEVKMVTGR